MWAKIIQNDVIIDIIDNKLSWTLRTLLYMDSRMNDLQLQMEMRDVAISSDLLTLKFERERERTHIYAHGHIQYGRGTVYIDKLSSKNPNKLLL